MDIILTPDESLRFSGPLGLLVLSEALFEMARTLVLTEVVVTWADGQRVALLGDEGGQL